MANALNNTKSGHATHVLQDVPQTCSKMFFKYVLQDIVMHLGLSTFHCWMRHFEYILHIGYANPAHWICDELQVILLKDD